MRLLRFIRARMGGLFVKRLFEFFRGGELFYEINVFFLCF